MDPLSIPVAVAGLLGSAESVRRKVTLFLQSNPEAGNIAESVLLEVYSIEASFPRLRRLIEADRNAARNYIFLDQLSTVLTGCVKRFAELETLLGGLPTIKEGESRYIDESHWARNEKCIKIAVDRLQPYKLSLILILQVLELQSLRDHNLSLERMQGDIEQLRDSILSGDPDLAVRISKADMLIGSDTASIASGSTGMTTQSTSPASPTRELHSAQAARHPLGWRSAWRAKNRHPDDTAQRPSRPASVTTSSSSISGSTVTSSSSASSRISLAALSDVSVYKLPITAEEVSNGHRYIGLAVEPIVTDVEEDGINEVTAGIGELTAAGSSTHRKALPDSSRPESRATSALGFRTFASSKQDPGPTAEIEMSARKYQGYWRASFTANVPAATAMCGCILLIASSASFRQRLIESEEMMERARNLCDALADAVSPAKVMQTLHAYGLETILFALKVSLDSGLIPVVPAKTAFSLYQKIEEASGDAKKRAKVWPHVAKALKKVPQDTMVPLMFVITIGRKLRSKGVMVGDRSAAFWLMESFWPQIGSRSLLASDTEAGDAASQVLLENYDHIPDELPVILQAINYRFESGSRCNLLALLSPKKPRPEMGSRSGSMDTVGS